MIINLLIINDLQRSDVTALTFFGMKWRILLCKTCNFFLEYLYVAYIVCAIKRSLGKFVVSRVLNSLRVSEDGSGMEVLCS